MEGIADEKAINKHSNALCEQPLAQIDSSENLLESVYVCLVYCLLRFTLVGIY